MINIISGNSTYYFPKAEASDNTSFVLSLYSDLSKTNKDFQVNVNPGVSSSKYYPIVITQELIDSLNSGEYNYTLSDGDLVTSKGLLRIVKDDSGEYDPETDYVIYNEDIDWITTEFVSSDALWQSGYTSGMTDGLVIGYSSGYSAGYSSGWTDGYSSGYSSGYTDGFEAGWESASSIVHKYECLHFKALNNCTFYFDTQHVYTIDMKYKINDGAWIQMTFPEGYFETTLNSGDTIYFKGLNSSFDYYDSFDAQDENGNYAYFNIAGNVATLLDDGTFTATSITNLTGIGVFGHLFYGGNEKKMRIVNADDLVFPFTSISGSNVYNGLFEYQDALISANFTINAVGEKSCMSMFRGCSSLVTTPKLPSTELAGSCYWGMFKGCTSLTTAPELPSTTLAIYCYREMFNGCTSLTTAPALPATTLGEYCYHHMFEGCTSLTKAPEFPATRLKYGCYSYMFCGCTSLATAPELPSTELADSCYYSMFEGCTSLTTAPELPATTLASNCYYRMFFGCTSLTTAPALPATTLASSCYYRMFFGCTSLTTAPALPATTLAYACYEYMFYGCKSLNKVTTYANNISAQYCLIGWLNGVSESGDFYNYGSATYPSGPNGIPRGWTEHRP